MRQPLIFQCHADPRKHHLRRVRLLLKEFPVVALLGARQVGKSTLARQLTALHRGRTTWFDLENPADLARLSDPGLELRPLRGLVVLDEIQRLPDVYPLLRVLADRPRTPARFLVLGSASPEQCFHWSTHSGAKLDLLVVAGNRRFGFEVKRVEAPRPTPSMGSAFETLGLDRLDVVHAGTESYAMAPGIRALPAARLATELRPLQE